MRSRLAPRSERRIPCVGRRTLGHMQQTTHLIVALGTLGALGLAFAYLRFFRRMGSGTGRRKAEEQQELDAEPTVPISAVVPFGVAKVSGEVRPSGSGLVAPVSGTSCVYWAVTLYSRTINHRLKADAPLRVVFAERAVPFDVHDGSGAARIELGTLETVPPGPGHMWQETRFPGVDVLRAKTLRRRTEEMAPGEDERILTMFGFPPGTYQKSVHDGFDTLLTGFAVEEVRIEPGERLIAFGQGSRANGQAPLVLAPAPDRRLLLASADPAAGGFSGSEGLKMAGYAG